MVTVCSGPNLVCTGFGNPPPKCTYHPNASNRDEPSVLFARFARRLPPDVKVRFLVVCDAIARYGLSLIDALCISSCASRCGRRCSVAAGQRRRFSYAGGRWRQAISSACNERIAAFQRPLAGATPPEPRNLKKTMKQRQQPTGQAPPSSGQCGVQGGGGGE